MATSPKTPFDVTVDYEMSSLSHDVEHTIKRARTLKAHLAKASTRKFIATMMAWKCDNVQVYPFVSSNELYISIRISNLDGFKDTKLEGMITALEFLNPDSTRMNEHPAFFSKEFQYEYITPSTNPDERGVRTHVHLTAKIVEDSKTCERVLVGMTEGKPQPIYKLVCDGQAATEADAPATEE